MQSSKNPWGRISNIGKTWKEFDSGFRTPFEAFARILIGWPSDLPTAEGSDETRHNRLIETIAGYPEIAKGKRPLDFPFHSMSIEALKLSLYLDGIGVKADAEEFEWHSLRTLLLDSDLNLSAKKEPPWNKSNHIKILHTLIHNIEAFEGVDGDVNSEQGAKLSQEFKVDKSNFLRVLHSSTNNRLAYWKEDYSSDFLENSLLNFMIDSTPSGEGVSSGEGYFYEHTIKFQQIQTWIRWYSAAEKDKTSPLNENIRHNLQIGASAILEGIFAKIRSKVLAERRPGSITIDGGGRINFISKNREEEQWLKQIIEESLMLDPSSSHPFAPLLEKKIREWGIHTHHLPFGPLKQGRLGQFIRYQFRQIATKCYPLASYTLGEDQTSSSGSNEFSSHMDEQCHFCKKHTDGVPENSPKSFLEQFNQEHDFSKEGYKTQVCSFHYLLFYLGHSVKMRQASQMMKCTFNPELAAVKHVVCLDGNGIGQIFSKPYEHITPPKFDQISDKGQHENSKIVERRVVIKGNQDLINALWTERSNEIIDLRKPWSEIKKQLKLDCGNDLTPEVNKKLQSRRIQAHIQRKRRSFSFNASWWIAFNKGIYSNERNHLEPMVAAGDDLVLVDRVSGNIRDVIETLNDFSKSLSEEFNNEIPISFGAGIAANSNKNIADAILKAYKAEQGAKIIWKQSVYQNQFGHLIKESAIPRVLSDAENLNGSQYKQPEFATHSEVPCVVHIWKEQQEV